MMDFRWNDWNQSHVGKHGVSLDEAEAVVREARAPYPESREDGKWLAIGRGQGDRLIQVVFLVDPDGAIYIIHARPLEAHENRRYRRRIR